MQLLRVGHLDERVTPDPVAPLVRHAERDGDQATIPLDDPRDDVPLGNNGCGIDTADSVGQLADAGGVGE